jgi:hypothetical protein
VTLVRFLVRFAPLVWLAAIAVLGCAHLPTYSTVGPTPSPTPTTSVGPTPTGTVAPCATRAPSTTVVVVISSTITAVTVPIYGTINGYTTLNPDGITFGNLATIIGVKSTDIVQFVNGESSGPAPINHSAVGFPGATSFPAAPYTFPIGTSQQLGSAISTLQWSTGRLQPLACFSQTFTVSTGTYYFGDLDYYNLDNTRDVLVVSP